MYSFIIKPLSHSKLAKNVLLLTFFSHLVYIQHGRNILTNELQAETEVNQHKVISINLP